MEVSLKAPGQSVQLPKSIIDQLKNLHPRYKKYLSFFGGHPVSITKQSANQIFTQIVQKQDGSLQSPYLVCQKTDGVRYILLICHVQENNNIQQIDHHNENSQKNKSNIKCYLVSRQGQFKLVAYQTQMNIGKKWIKKTQGNFRQIIQILDGELIIDNIKNIDVCKYLVFDILVHMGQNVTSLPLIHRLKCINQFIQCNNFLLEQIPKQEQKHKIPIEIKDFFRLNSLKYNMVKFLLNKYIKCLPHQNDGLIFNHQACAYQFGMNTGYIKWKPAHLNTLDFMLVPNVNFNDRFQNRVLDMYLAKKDQLIQGNYVRYFYGFTVVSEEEFQEIQQQIRINQQKMYAQKAQNQQNLGDRGHFEGAVIAQCKYQQTTIQQRDIFRQIFSLKKGPSEIILDIMRPYNEKDEENRIQSLQKKIYDRCWKKYKIRDDKALPNNLSVAQKIQQSIKDDIREDQLIKKNDQLNTSCKPKY